MGNKPLPNWDDQWACWIETILKYGSMPTTTPPFDIFWYVDFFRVSVDEFLRLRCWAVFSFQPLDQGKPWDLLWRILWMARWPCSPEDFTVSHMISSTIGTRLHIKIREILDKKRHDTLNKKKCNAVLNNWMVVHSTAQHEDTISLLGNPLWSWRLTPKRLLARPSSRHVVLQRRDDDTPVTDMLHVT